MQICSFVTLLFSLFFLVQTGNFAQASDNVQASNDAQVIPVQADNPKLQQLLDTEQLSVVIKIQEAEQHIVGQALIVSIEVSTNRWFSQGSKINNFSLADTVMMANNSITINGSKKLKGTTWAMQTHELTLYPTRAGEYEFPSLKVGVSINTENNGVVSGLVTTPSQLFTISIPGELSKITNYIVSSEVTLTIDGQFTDESPYAVGEAITQTLTLSAIDTPAMMLPPLLLSVEEQEALNGVSIYHKPAKVFDHSNRGSLKGTRIESYTYIFEKAGEYTIPEKLLYWWNTSNNSLELITIPKSQWIVAKSVSAQSKLPSNSSYLTKKQYLSIIISIVVMGVLSLLLMFVYRHKTTFYEHYSKITKLPQRKLRHLFLQTIKNKDYLEAAQYLYKYSLLNKKQDELASIPLALKLNELAFKEQTNDHNNFGIKEAKQLLNQLKLHSNKVLNNEDFPNDKPIKLNV